MNLKKRIRTNEVVRKMTLFFFIGLLLLACDDEPKSTEKPLDKKQLVKDALTRELDSIQKNGLIPGFGVAIVNQEGTLYGKGFGVTDLETKRAYTQNTIQNIASVSKTLIGIALMKAQELGKLKLDDPIRHYLSFEVFNPNFPDDTISIRHLATHTSGINDTDQYMNRAWIIEKDQDLTDIRTDYPAQRLNPYEENVPMEDYLAGYLTQNGSYFQKDNYINFRPGQRFNYSNIGATLAALVIEKATGQAFNIFTKKYILDPLEMDASGWSLEEVDRSQHTRMYRNDNTVLPLYTAITYPDGMFISSASDMAKYLTELIKGYAGQGTLLSHDSYKELFREQLAEEHFEKGERNPDHPYDGDYNPAIFIGHSALGYVGHSGGDAGVATWLYFNKETLTGRYIVINTDTGNDQRARELEFYAIYDKMDQYIKQLNL